MLSSSGSDASKESRNLLRPQLRLETLRELYAEYRRGDMTNRQIAALLGISEGMVARDRRALGLNRGANGGQVRSEKAGQRRALLEPPYREWAARGLFIGEMASLAGVTEDEARHDLAALGLSRGHRHRNLTAADGTLTDRGATFVTGGVAARQRKVTQRVAEGKKRCSKCGETKNLTEDFSPSTTSADGYAGWCKPCANAARREREARQQEREQAAPRLLGRRAPDVAR
jgi:hypothetical protein